MKTIQISVDVFAAIWAARKVGEESEDDILRRMLAVSSPSSVVKQGGGVDFVDARYGVVFPAGFEIFRTYKGVHRSAKVVDGKWLLEGANDLYSSLNALSGAIGATTENAWLGWHFKDKNGRRRLISDLRDKNKILRRA